MQCKDCELWTTKRCPRAKEFHNGKWGTEANSTCESFILDEDIRLENKAW